VEMKRTVNNETTDYENGFALYCVVQFQFDVIMFTLKRDFKR